MGFIVDKSSGNWIFIGSQDMYDCLQEAMDEYAKWIVSNHRKQSNEVRKKRSKKK